MEKKVVAIKGVNIDLKNVSYYKEKNTVLGSRHSVNANQINNLVSVNDSSFFIESVFTVSMSPKLIEISIVISTELIIDRENTYVDFIDDFDMMKNHIESKVDEFMSNVNLDPYFISIVSQMTSWLGNQPLILRKEND